MQIQGASATNKDSQVSISAKQKSNWDDIISNLQKIKETYQERKTKIQTDTTLDAESKKTQLQEVDAQLQEISAQIEQAKLQKQQEAREVEEQKKAAKAEDNAPKTEEEIAFQKGYIVSDSLIKLMDAKSSMERIHSLREIKYKQEFEKQFIPYDANPNTYNNKRLNQIAKSNANLELAVNSEIKTMNKKVDIIEDKVIENNETQDNDASVDKVNTDEDTKAQGETGTVIDEIV